MIDARRRERIGKGKLALDHWQRLRCDHLTHHIDLAHRICRHVDDILVLESDILRQVPLVVEIEQVKHPVSPITREHHLLDIGTLRIHSSITDHIGQQ